MQWIELTIKTAPAAIDLVCDRLTVLGFDSFIVDDQEQFHEFLEQNRQYWDYVDEGLEKQMQGLSQIRLYLEQNASVPETVESLKSQLAALRAQYPSVDFGSLDVQLANVKDEDWENNWKQYYQPLPINQIFADRFTAVTGDVIGDKAMMESLKGHYDVVLANIVADIIIPLSRVVPAFLQEDSIFICSGILNTRLAEVLDALEKNGLQILSTEQQEDWCRVTAARAEA